MAFTAKQMKYISRCHNNTRDKTQSIPQNTKHSSLHTYQNRLHSQTRRRPPTHFKTTSVSHNIIHQTPLPLNCKSLKSTFLHHSNYISKTCTFHPAITNRSRLDYIQHIYKHNKSSKHIHHTDILHHTDIQTSMHTHYYGTHQLKTIKEN